MYITYVIHDWWIYHTVKMYNMSRRIFLFKMNWFLINHLQCCLNWRWLIKIQNLIWWKTIFSYSILYVPERKSTPMEGLFLSTTSISIVYSVVLILVEKAAKSSTIWKIFWWGYTWISWWNGNFSSINLIPGRSGFYAALWRIIILSENFLPRVSTFFYTCWQNVHEQIRKTFQHLFYHGTVLLQLHLFHNQLLW